MRRLAAIAWLTCASVLFTTILLVWNPFETAISVLGRIFGAAPKWTQISNLIRDPATQELSRGEKALGSFRALESVWARQPGVKRVVLIGNSQMISVSLAPGEGPPTGPEPTWVDHATRLQPEAIAPYRLSAPGMSYTEALWYLLYLTNKPALRPDAVMLQLNFQSFWNGGIRSGMQELLDDESFRIVIERETASEAAYAETFREALAEWRESRKRRAKPETGQTSVARMPGLAVDQQVRAWLDQAPAFRNRGELKVSFLELLYQLRVYLLRLTPTTARSITGTRWERSKASVAAVADLCREKGVRLILYNAPVNPRVNLYRTAADRSSFLSFIGKLNKRPGVGYYDLETAVPKDLWGLWMNGPDPLHLGRNGHLLLGQRMAGILSAELSASAQGAGHGL